MVDLSKLPEQASALKKIINKQQVLCLQQQEKIEHLQEMLWKARHEKYGKHSEAVSSKQLGMFNEAEELVEEKESEDKTEIKAHKREKPKRKPLPENLPREDVVIELPEKDRTCPHDGHDLKEIGEEVSEQLDYIPAQYKVIRTIRKKYACPCCENGVKTAAMPERILPKSNATPGLLSCIAISKYNDALPLYRLEQIFNRHGIEIPRQTMAGWMIKLGEALQPVWNMMEEDLLSGDYLCCDESHVQVLREDGKRAESKSYMWVRTRAGPRQSPIVLFDYSPSRSKEVANELLSGFKGYLQVDGYAGYNDVCKSQDVVRVGCMAHVRRKFYDAFKNNKKHKSLSGKVIKIFKKLYQVEEKIKDKSDDDRLDARQKESVPLMNQLKTIVFDQTIKAAPGMLIGKAITYAKNEWENINQYLSNGKLNIDNNFTENRIRPFALGRKNWLFSVSVAGAKSSAILYSIIETAKGNGMEPYSYLKYLLTELPKAKSADQIEKLLPHRVDAKNFLFISN